MDKLLKVNLLRSLSSSIITYSICERCGCIKNYLSLVDGIKFLIDFIMKSDTIDDVFYDKILLMWVASKYYDLVHTINNKWSRC